MRDSFAGSWVMTIVILFTVIFSGYIAVTIAYSRTFKIKNEMLSMVEKNQGFTENARRLINNYLINNGDTKMGFCRDFDGAQVYGVRNIDGAGSVEPANIDTRYYYCIAKYSSNNSHFPKRSYYKVKLFFDFNLPVFGHIFTFDVDGQTTEMDVSYDEW